MTQLVSYSSGPFHLKWCSEGLAAHSAAQPHRMMDGQDPLSRWLHVLPLRSCKTLSRRPEGDPSEIQACRCKQYAMVLSSADFQSTDHSRNALTEMLTCLEVGWVKVWFRTHASPEPERWSVWVELELRLSPSPNGIWLQQPRPRAFVYTHAQMRTPLSQLSTLVWIFLSSS